VRLTPGSRLGPYEVLSILGVGGMAEVYRARDTRLGREIALKVVNEALASDPELMRRFEQEARLAGSLNHPNLVAVYDVGLHDGAAYFITELLKGESLRQRLSRGPIPIQTAIDWGTQLAEGLAAAHARGIVHRDVKPDNVFITSDGHVKLLDFGIAKLAEGKRAEFSHGILEQTLTPAGGETQTGAIVGTPAYMAPEQIRGEQVDPRTDIFSLGAVLYEMLSGHRPFAGSSLIESGHAILHAEPPSLPEGVRPAVAQVVRRCLEKEPSHRLQCASDLAFALEVLRSDVVPPPKSLRKVHSFFRRPWWAVALVALLVAAIALNRLKSVQGPPALTVERVTFRTIAWPRTARFTPDGRVVFTERVAGTEEIFERNLAGQSIQPLGLQNMVLAAVSSTNELAVLLTSFPFDWESRRASLARVPGGGGTPQIVAEDVVSADWGPSGELAIVRRTRTGFVLEFPIGKTLFQTTRPGWIGNLRVSPRGDLLAFIHHPGGDYDGEAVILDLQGKKRQVSRHWYRAYGLAWSFRDQVWFSAGESLPTQIEAMPVSGPERTVYTALAPIAVQDIAPDGSVLLGQGFSGWDISFLGEGASTLHSLAWNDFSFSPRLSADGRLALFSARGTHRELVTLLRKTNGAPPQNLGEGIGRDLTPDGRSALLQSGGTLTIVPTRGATSVSPAILATGTGTRRSVALDWLELGSTRFLRNTSRAISVAQATADPGFRLYSIDLDSPAVNPLSEPGLDPQFLEISPNNNWAATVAWNDGQGGAAIHPLAGGKPFILSELGPDVAPAGWASDDEVWLARVVEADPSSFGLIRYDVRRRTTVEQRTVGTSGDSWIRTVNVTPNGKNVVFGQLRTEGHLYVVRGMPGAH